MEGQEDDGLEFPQAVFGQGYIHNMLVFNLAPLIVSAGALGGTHVSPSHSSPRFLSLFFALCICGSFCSL